jgi:hypothetical protein
MQPALSLQQHIAVNVVDGDELPYSARLVLAGLSIIVGPYNSGLEHERHFLDTIGSGSWHAPEYDELRFSVEDRRLKSVWFRIPERNAGEPAPWASCTKHRGTLELTGASPSQLSLSSIRTYDPGTDLFACVRADAINVESGSCFCLRIAEDLEIVFADGEACGWRLHHAVRHLVAAWEQPTLRDDDPRLAEAFAEYLALVAEPNIEAIEDEDEEIERRLRQLSERVSKLDDTPQRRALGDAVSAILW